MQTLPNVFKHTKKQKTQRKVVGVFKQIVAKSLERVNIILKAEFLQKFTTFTKLYSKFIKFILFHL